MKQYEENGYLVIEYDSGAIVKTLISKENNGHIEYEKTPTVEERIANMETTLDLILLKQEGII